MSLATTDTWVAFTNACAENGAPESLRHITQWHMDTAVGLPVSTTETAPQRQVPVRVTASTDDASSAPTSAPTLLDID